MGDGMKFSLLFMMNLIYNALFCSRRYSLLEHSIHDIKVYHHVSDDS